MKPLLWEMGKQISPLCFRRRRVWKLVQWDLEKADLWEYVDRLPNGMYTVLLREFDDQGLNLSGGQSQKLALARIFAQENKQMLIMDEVSAALDPYSEAIINQNVLDFAKTKS